MSKPPRWELIPDDPRAPSDDIWTAMSPDERAAVVAALPSYMPKEALQMAPEGDTHNRPIDVLRDSLRRHFGHQGRDAYIGHDLLVYYPAERVFAPDVFVALDVGSHDRECWSVQAEGKGLDLAIEILVRGNRKKDLQRNVEWFARLKIPEYVVFEPERQRIHMFRLPDGGGPYSRVVPQGGKFRCETLGLDIIIQQGLMRFINGDTPLPTTLEVEATLNGYLDESFARAEREAKRAQEADERAKQESERAKQESERAKQESERAKQESERANALEAQLADALARIAELTNEPK